MDIQNIFLILGAIYFALSLLILTVVVVVFVSYYLKFRKQLGQLKHGFDVVSRSAGWVGKRSPILITFLSAILAGALKQARSRRKNQEEG